jgi:hypothetical protein
VRSRRSGTLTPGVGWFAAASFSGCFQGLVLGRRRAANSVFFSFQNVPWLNEELVKSVFDA